MVYLGRGVELSARKGYGRIVLGRWVHLGDGNRLLVNEGTLRIGDKTVFGLDNTVACYLDIAEQDIADSHLTWEERRAVWQQRIRQREQLRRSKFLAFQERVFGKAAADDLRAKYAKLDEEHRRRMRDLDRYLVGLGVGDLGELGSL